MPNFSVRQLDSLDEVNASALPANVLVLLSKYANALRKHNGLILKLSSMNIFRHVHSTNKVSKHDSVHIAYEELLSEVRQQVKAGSMYTNAHKRFKDKRAKRHYSAVRPSRSASVKQRAASNLQSSVKTHGHIMGSKELEPRLSAFAD